MAEAHEPEGRDRTGAEPANEWPAASRRLIGGFWEKAGAMALPRDTRGEGYGELLRTHSVEIAYCTLFVFTSSFGQTFFLSLFSPYWATALGLSSGTMGLVYGLATLAAGMLLPLSGRWLDSAPSGRAGLVAFGGLVAACLLAAEVSSLWMLALAMFLLRFFGQGMCVNVGLTRAARWFDYNRGKAVSLAVVGFPLGEALLPVSVILLIHVLGWRWAWVAVAAVCALVLAPAAAMLLARRRAQYGMAQPPEGGRAATRAEFLEVLRDWRFYAMLVVTGPVPFVGTGIIFFQGMIAEARGWHAAVVPTGFIVFALVRALFSISAGAWADRLGSLRLLAVPTTLFGAGLGFLTLDSPAFAYVFFALFGVGFGASSGVMTTAWTELFGAQRIGLIRGLSGAVGVAATALSPMAFGWAHEAGVPLNAVLWGSVAFMIVCAWPMCGLLARYGRRTGAAAGANRHAGRGGGPLENTGA